LSTDQSSNDYFKKVIEYVFEYSEFKKIFEYVFEYSALVIVYIFEYFKNDCINQRLDSLKDHSLKYLENDTE
jgi:hypothetical protein